MSEHTEEPIDPPAAAPQGDGDPDVTPTDPVPTERTEEAPSGD